MPTRRSQALALSCITVAYNLVEGCVAMVAAASSGSNAILGFGLDSFIESLSGAVMVWRFWKFELNSDEEDFERLEQRAARLVACSFFLLGAYVTLDAGYALFRQEAPETSLIGIGLALASLIFMPILFLLKYRLGEAIGSRSLVADSKETLACWMLSLALLLGLGAFYVWRLWWIDSVAALVIAVLIVREGFETLEEAGGESGKKSPRPIVFSCEATLGIPPDEIAAQILDLRNWPQFEGYGPLPGIRHAEFETQTAEVVGTRIRVTNRDGSSHIEAIVEWDLDRRLRLHMREFSPPLSWLATGFDETWEFRLASEGTKVVRSFELHPKFVLAKPVLWLIARLLKRAIARHLEQMRQARRPDW